MIPAARPIVGDEERAAVDRVLRSGMIAQGPEVVAFENEFGEFVDGHYCVAVNSGTSALHLALLAAGIGPGDEVVVPSFTFAATANSVALCGATPVFADIDPLTYCLDPAAAEAAISKRTAAVMPVHLYGHPANLTALDQVCKSRGLALLEDAAQAHGATWSGRPVGTVGLAGAFSFYPTKNMTAGEGGMLVTADAALARKARLLRNQGMERRYENEVVGFNYRMTDIHAAIGRVQLRKLAGWTEARQRNAKELDSRLDSISGITTPVAAAEATHVYHQYTVRVFGKPRDEVSRRLRDLGVGSGVYYPIPVHKLPSFRVELELSETTRAAREVLSLPIHPSLTDEDLSVIADALRTALS